MTLVDDEDEAAVLAAGPWHLTTGGYAAHTVSAPRTDAGRPSPRIVRLHRLLLCLADDDPRQVDHINRDRLDNRRANLRIVDKVANRQNRSSVRGSSSRHRGVTWDKDRKRWMAQVEMDGRSIKLGRFTDEDAAGEAAAAWRRQHMAGATD